MQHSRLPLELLQHIVGNIDYRRDLLHAAQACHALREISRPYLDYWAIRAELCHSDLWEQLSRGVDSDICASRIRSITIFSQHEFGRREDLYDKGLQLPPGAPPFNEDARGGDSKELIMSMEVLLARALRRMVNLEHFSWHRYPAPLVHGQGGIWDTLKGLGTVVNFDFYEPTDSPSLSDTSEEDEPINLSTSLGTLLCRTFLTHGNLRELRLSVHWQDQIWYETLNLDGIETLALACPNLEVLVLDLGPDEYASWDYDNIDRLMYNALWPKLRKLELEGVECASDALMRFLIAHPSLEHLRLAFAMLIDSWGSPSTFSLPEDALPKLHTLECTSAQAVQLLAGGHRRAMRTLLRVDVHERLSLQYYLAGEDDPEGGGLWALAQSESTLEATMILPWRARLMDCLRETPGITHIGVSGPCCGRDGFPRLPDIELLAEAAPKLKGLTVVFTESNRLPPQSEMIQIWACFPALERIGRYRAIEHRLPAHWSAFTPDDTAFVSDLLRKILAVCPQLKILEIDQNLAPLGDANDLWHYSRGKIVVLRQEGASGGDGGGRLRWVGRRTWEKDEGDPFDGELCYDL